MSGLKRALLCLALFIWMGASGLCLGASGADTAVNGLYYRANADGRTATVTGWRTAPVGKLDIPSQVELGGTSYAVSAIGARAFEECNSVTSVTAPSVVTVGERAFYSCGALREASFPSAATVGPLAFQCCTRLETVSFPRAVTLESQAFAYSGLRKIPGNAFPSVTTIGHAAFYYCISLTEASFPAAKAVDTGAFVRNGLSKADFPSAERLGQMAFLDNRKLPEIVLPSGVTLGNYAFTGCHSLKAARFLGPATLGQWVFASCPRDFTIQYPADGQDSWAGWSNPEKYRLAMWSKN